MRAGSERAYRVIQEVAGPLAWESATCARGNVRGQPVWIEHVHGRGQADKFRVCVSLEGRPIMLAIRRRSSAPLPTRELKTGIAAFDNEYQVRGEPADVVRAVLDLPTVAWVWHHYHGADPALGVSQGLLKVQRDFPDVAAEATGVTQPDTPQVLEELTTGLQELARRLVAAYDRAYRHVSQTHGVVAAAQWQRLHAARSQELQQLRAPGPARVRALAIVVGLAAVFATLFVLWLGLHT